MSFRGKGFRPKNCCDSRDKHSGIGIREEIIQLDMFVALLNLDHCPVGPHKEIAIFQTVSNLPNKYLTVVFSFKGRKRSRRRGVKFL